MSDLMSRDLKDAPWTKEAKAQPILRQMRDQIEELRLKLAAHITDLEAILPELSDFDPLGDANAYCADFFANQVYFVEQSIERHHEANKPEERSDYDEHNTLSGGLHAHGMWGAAAE